MAKKNVNYKAILKDGLILMIAGLVFAFVVKLGFDQLQGDVKENPLITYIIQDNFDKIKDKVEGKIEVEEEYSEEDLEIIKELESESEKKEREEKEKAKKEQEDQDNKPVDINQQDAQGRTPLMWASYLNYGDRKIIFQKKESEKKAAMSCSCFWDNDETKKFSCSCSSPIAESDKGSEKEDSRSLEEKRLEMVKYFLEKGAKTDIKDEDGWTALHWASWTGMPTIVAELVKAGSDVNALDNHKQSSLMIASQRGNDKVVEILINAGADRTLKNDNGLDATDFVKKYYQQFKDKESRERYIATYKALKSQAQPKPVETPAEEVKEEPKAEEAAEAAPAEAEAKPAEEAKPEEAAPAEKVKEAPAEEAKAEKVKEAPKEEAAPAEEKPAE